MYRLNLNVHDKLLLDIVLGVAVTKYQRLSGNDIDAYWLSRTAELEELKKKVDKAKWVDDES